MPLDNPQRLPEEKIEWEGDVEYLKNDLPDVVSAIIAALGVADANEEREVAETPALKARNTFTTASLAAKIKPKTAADLFKIALAKLQISDNIETASRGQIHKEMKLAPKFYKQAMRNNLGNTIDTLLQQGAINEPSKDEYSLSQAEHDQLESEV